MGKDTLIAGLIAGLRANACVVHEAGAAEAASVLTERVGAHVGTGPVAVNAADPVLGALHAVDVLRAAGCDVVIPDDHDWSTGVRRAAVGVTGAAFSIAQPAAMGVPCGPGMARATSLLPPVHVCVLYARDVVPTFADAIARLGTGPLPSAFTWVGGPSRTGDLEMVQTLGVHGPVVVEVVVVHA